MQLDIVIVTYRSARHLPACLAPLPFEARVVVVENASGDDAPDLAAATGADVIRNDVNAGFGAAANQGAAELGRAGKWQEQEKVARKSQALAAELNKLQSEYGQYELRVANALWGEKSYPFRQSYWAWHEVVQQIQGACLANHSRILLLVQYHSKGWA